MKLGALFDWDGVIIDSSAQHEESWTLLANEIGKPLPADHFLRGFGMKSQVIIPEILHWTTDPDEIHNYSLRKEQLYREIVREHGITPLPWRPAKVPSPAASMVRACCGHYLTCRPAMN